MMSHTNNHQRSLSSGPRSRSPERTVTKAKSTNDIHRAISDNFLHNPVSGPDGFPESNFSTIRDPRLSHSPEDSESSSSPSHHPDLNNEVAALSVKLVQAINNQTTLDDNLVAARQELEDAQARVQVLELENGKYRRDIDQKVLVKKAHMDDEISFLKASLAEEKAQREHAEKGKKTIEQELEALTAALFEEANKVIGFGLIYYNFASILTSLQMVASAKLEREAVEKKNEQLRSQIKDTELLLASHQDQLAELKAAMHRGSPGKDETDTHTTVSTTPSSPAGTRQRMVNTKRTLEVSDASEIHDNPEETLPASSTSFPNFIKLVCRTDIPAYEDFRELFSITATSKPPSRAASGSYGGLNVMSLAGLTGHSGGFGSASSSPAKSQTHSPNGSMSSPLAASSHISLKESRFYKRVLAEDIEPTLRLDMAPGISWLTRRAVLSGICEGSLLVEPMPLAAKKFGFACSICGEHRAGTVNERTHRFRTSDSETAQRYPLCVLCLEKVRSCCEFTGYLRLILDGHIRVGDAEEERDAWEETIRLRERVFWSRVGGGVLPVFPQTTDVDGSVREATSTASLYSNDNAAHPPLPIESIGAQPSYEHDIDQGSATDEHFLSATEQSSASSTADASPSLEETGSQVFNFARRNAPEQAVEQFAGSVTVKQNEEVAIATVEQIHSGDEQVAKAENHGL